MNRYNFIIFHDSVTLKRRLETLYQKERKYYQQTMNKKILPINEFPSLISVIHHAYPSAIIESRSLAEVSLLDDENEYRVYVSNVEAYIQDGKIYINQTAEKDMDAVLFRNCAAEDEIIVKIEYLKQFTNDRYIDLFICGDDEEEIKKEIKKRDKTCGFRWNQYGYFLKSQMFNYDTKKYKYLKISKKPDKIEGYASYDEVNWIFLAAQKIIEEDEMNKKNIGIHIHLGGDTYSAWKNMNFIQLALNADNEWKGIYLDYFFFPRKGVDNSYMFFPNFLDTSYEILYDVMDCFETIHDYIHWSIDHFYYPDLCLDEFYVPERKAYNQYSYNHYNLFYGYDDEEENYYLMGYGIQGKPVVSKVPYSSITIENIKSEKIIRYKCCHNDVKEFSFDINIVKQAIYEFLHSVNSGLKFSNIIATEDMFFGLSSLEALVNDERGRFLLLKDKRIVYSIFEHSKLMLEHIEYFFANSYLKPEAYKEVKDKNLTCIHQAGKLLVLVLKNIMGQNEEEKIYAFMQELICFEKDLFEELYNAL